MNRPRAYLAAAVILLGALAPIGCGTQSAPNTPSAAPKQAATHKRFMNGPGPGEHNEPHPVACSVGYASQLYTTWSNGRITTGCDEPRLLVKLDNQAAAAYHNQQSRALQRWNSGGGPAPSPQERAFQKKLQQAEADAGTCPTPSNGSLDQVPCTSTRQYSYTFSH